MSIFGMEPSRDMPEGWQPLEGIAVIKCLSPEGDLCLSMRSTSGLTEWDVLGMLEAAKASIARDVAIAFADIDLQEEEEEDDDVPSG